MISCDSVKTFWLTATAGKALDNDQLDKAITKYEKLIELHPDDYTNYWNLGVADAHKGDWVNAKKQAKKLEELGRNDLANEMYQYLKEKENTQK